MNPNYPWYQHRSDAFKAVHKWVKRGIASSKREKLFYKYNCVLPSSQKESPQWNHVVDAEATVTLEGLHCLNWYQETTRLHVIKLPQDNESFYHSIFITLWGKPDSKGYVKHLIQTTLKLHTHIWERRFDPARGSKIEALKMDDGRLMSEHIFILSNILQRPIIIVSSEDKNTTLEEKHHDLHSFFGIYLPLMSKPINCSKMPIFLAFHNGNFFPLVMEVPTEESQGILREKYSVVFPLVKSDFGMLPIKYVHDSGEMRAGEILQDYLIVKDTYATLGDKSARLVFTHSECHTLPKDKNVIWDFMMSWPHYDQKLHNRTKLMKQPLKIAKSLLHTINSGSPHLIDAKTNGSTRNFQLTGDHVLRGQQLKVSGKKEMIDQSVKMDTGAYFLPDLNEPFRLEANAPQMPEESMEPLSMTRERCASCKSYRSSVNTFPLCHECHEQRNKMNEKQTNSGNSAFSIHHSNKSTMQTSVSDQHARLKNYSEGNSENVIVLPTMIESKIKKVNINNGNEEEKNCTGIATATMTNPKMSKGNTNKDNEEGETCTGTGIATAIMRNSETSKVNSNNNSEEKETCTGELSTSRNSLGSDGNLVESSCQSSLGQHNMVNDAPTTCASPVCNNEIFSPEVLCQSCIKILKIHYLSNCNKSCCFSPSQNANAPLNNSEIDMNGNQDIEMIPNDFSFGMTSSKKQPVLEVENNHTIPSPDSHVCHNKSGICRSLSLPESPNPENYLSKNCNMERTISEPESDKYDLKNMSYSFPTSLMVTNLTSIDETNVILDGLFPNTEKTVENEKGKLARSVHFGNGKNTEDDILKANRQGSNLVAKSNGSKQDADDYHQTMEYLERNVRKGANRCKSYLCPNYGSKHRDGYCNKCFSELKKDSYHGIADCDGEDQIDGLDTVTDVTDVHHTIQDVSFDTSDFFSSESDSDDLEFKL